ncbi:hypothetical protein CRV01_08235 [Arcobacter sp. CECT 8983]|uniref:Gfo/Idh/MocA family protein n=1 Tax=Arcobacter sp. CECT 8983 TaxID=2044508 RepID=UPI00100B5428|nr:Gfo/Idh/MocA family oxidoreductase [Arcobacter sp. CECT 8983]RXJ89455.1 hypothetical protein CRV01_08235 [Arcobacter sp. CECT 8983]
MKALFVGLGSIGQRHLQNLKALYPNDFEIYQLKHSNNNLYIKDGEAREVENLAKFYEIKELTDLNSALQIEPDIVFITNPSSCHLDTAITFAEIGANLFIEKPLSNNYDKVEYLKQIIKDKNLICMIGYQTRFHPLIKKLKYILEEKIYGSITSANIEWGTFLPSHHKYEDYKKGYAAREDLGGGVIHSLSHELDLLNYFFGKPSKVLSVESSNSIIDINAEDTVFSLFKYQENDKQFVVSLNLSFAQVYETRSIKISLSNAVIILDLVENELKVFNEKGLIDNYLVNESFKRNDLFLSEMKHFINSVNTKNNSFLTIDDGIDSLEMAISIKEAINANE